MRMLSRSSFFRRMVRLRRWRCRDENERRSRLFRYLVRRQEELTFLLITLLLLLQNTHVSHDQCGRFPNHSTTGSVKCHVTDNFAVFLATEFTLQTREWSLAKIEKSQDDSRVFGRLHSPVFRMRFCVHIENTATKNLKFWNTAVFHCKWEWPCCELLFHSWTVG